MTITTYLPASVVAEVVRGWRTDHKVVVDLPSSKLLIQHGNEERNPQYKLLDRLLAIRGSRRATADLGGKMRARSWLIAFASRRTTPHNPWVLLLDWPKSYDSTYGDSFEIFRGDSSGSAFIFSSRLPRVVHLPDLPVTLFHAVRTRLDERSITEWGALL